MTPCLTLHQLTKQYAFNRHTSYFCILVHSTKPNDAGHTSFFLIQFGHLNAEFLLPDWDS
jgi:hypothetical protein